MVKIQATNNGVKVRSVEEYLRMVKLAGRSDITIRNYRAVLTSYAQFMEIPLDKVHESLSVENLIAYASSRVDKSQNGRKTTLTILHRYFKLNGVVFDELEANVMKQTVDKEQDDKPIELAMLQKMMAIASPHAQAIITFLVSTGCRAGECSKLRLSDVKGDIVTIPNEIAKRRKGGKVFLTAEARMYLDIWLKNRDTYIAEANMMTSRLLTSNTGHKRIARKETGKPMTRPVQDDRLFACSYSTMNKIFLRLYNNIDGEKGKYGAKCTLHSLRAFFRTRSVQGGVSIDLAEGLLRHTGYLNAAYVQMTDDEKRKQFHAHEDALYLTFKDRRKQDNELAELRRENEELAKDVAQLRAILEVPHDEAVPSWVIQVPTNLPKDKQEILNRGIAQLNQMLAALSQ